MASVSWFGHGIYCYDCQTIYNETDECEHGLHRMAGVQKTLDGDYFAQPDNMGHNSPHHYIEVDGMQMCAECNRVKIPDEMLENHSVEADTEHSEESQ